MSELATGIDFIVQAPERRPDPPHSFRFDLRGRTAASHERVDAAFGRFSLTDPAGYRFFLQAHHAVLPVCERALAASGAASLLTDWPSRVRTPALLADMDAVGAAAGLEIPTLPPLSPAAAFGMMYVLEGSRLGGAVLARRLLTNPDESCRTASRYLLHGEGLRLWPNFVAAMECSPHVLQDPQSVIASALQTFGLFETAAINTRDTP